MFGRERRAMEYPTTWKKLSSDVLASGIVDIDDLVDDVAARPE